MAAEHFLFAEPELDQIAEINDRYPGVSAPPVRLLPTNLPPSAVGDIYPGPERWSSVSAKKTWRQSKSTSPRIHS